MSPVCPPQAVSFADEPLILVDADGQPIGHRPKADCHAGTGLLHLAFSVFLFDAQGRLLLQQRSADKPLWPGFWANSCCSHPRRGETLPQAAERRVREELGLRCVLSPIYRFVYHAQYGAIGAEHEDCTVFVGRMQGAAAPHPQEIADTAYLAPEALDRALERQPTRYAPWLHLEWPALRQLHWAATLRALASNPT